MDVLKRSAAFLCIVGVALVFAGEFAALWDLFIFEYAPLYQLLGGGGVALILLVNAGLAFLLYRAVQFLRRRQPRFRRVSMVVMIAAAVALAGLLQYMFMEMPLTVTAAISAKSPLLSSPSGPETADFANFSLTRRALNPEARTRLRVMYDRIRLNSPQVYERNPVGATIDEYAARYEIDPIFLFFRAYINSFYGEALAGPVPFFRTMTSETIRDVVQVHLPSWFIESAPRIWLISTEFFPKLVGEGLGFKLRYAVHKANLDVSTQPYDVSAYSDVFMVMREYPEEFNDVLQAPATDELRSSLKQSFMALRDSAMLPPYADAYGRAAYGPDYYDQHRDDLKRFARSAYYLTVLDFTFSTRIQALLSKYQTGLYETSLGADRWAQLPDWQRLVMLAMIRDLYTPNVGRLGYNLYALPELNCTPVDYVASQASAVDGSILGSAMAEYWRPQHSDYLWGGAGYQLRVLNEVWSAINPTPIPGVGFERTVEDARGVLAAAGS